MCEWMRVFSVVILFLMRVFSVVILFVFGGTSVRGYPPSVGAPLQIGISIQTKSAC